jgi:phage gpG-like protein
MASRIDKLPFASVQRIFVNYQKQLPTIVATSAVSFFKGSFRRQGWVYDGKLKRWKPRSKNAKRNRGRAILIDSGKLRRSIRTIHKSSQYIEVGSELEYAAIHNDGGKVKGTARVPGFTRKAHKVKGHKRTFKGKVKKIKAHTRDATNVRSHTRELDFTVDQRQFIGESPDVLKRAERDLFRHLDNQINKLV